MYGTASCLIIVYITVTNVQKKYLDSKGSKEIRLEQSGEIDELLGNLINSMFVYKRQLNR